MKNSTKLLVANRSEIACRVFQSCAEMGIKTVAVFAPGDEDARHVSHAEEIFSIDSYLNAQSIISVAKKAGVTHIHPGYGFLSERSHFVRACDEAGIEFIGPTAESMDLLGGKIAAKELAASIGVPTLPWAKVTKGEDIVAEAKRVGFPLLLKAAAGGGGKGMRRVEKESELVDAAESASAEAIAAFGDGTLFLEKLVDQPRHIEVQVFGDGKGFGVHLHERECSLQRRHQKVWEEATAPRLREETRRGLFNSALKLVEKVKYRNAGTIEFLVDAEEGYYFLEMNTRLQVEHPVSEIVTGVDLVRLQIEQALNPNSAAIKNSPEARGSAIEVRIYAEDPSQGYIPQTGQIEKLRWPMGAGIRVDTGIEVGQKIGTQFDSMLAKLIVYAPNRAAAVSRLHYALTETSILGVGTNLNFLKALAENENVQKGIMDTGLLGREFSQFQSIPNNSELSIIQNAREKGHFRESILSQASSQLSEANSYISPLWKGIQS